MFPEGDPTSAPILEILVGWSSFVCSTLLLQSIFTLKYLVQLRQHYTKPVFIKLIILGGDGVVVEAGVVVASVEVDAAVVERVVV